MQVRRRLLMGINKEIQLPYVYKDGRFASALGAMNVKNPPMKNYAVPDDYELTPNIYIHLVRNSTPPANDALALYSANEISIADYTTVTIKIETLNVRRGMISLHMLSDSSFVENGKRQFAEIKFTTDNEPDGEHSFSIPLQKTYTNGLLGILVQAYAPYYDEKIWINEIMFA